MDVEFRALREILNDIWVMEESGAQPTSSLDVESRLHQLRHSYKITAFAMRRPYISREEVISYVLSTGMHVNAERNCQFALAVHICPFVNHIVSYSVAIATLRQST